jgi:hypothetical protein
MTDLKERHFSIDPGKGMKMDGCPCSIYEDGRDVKGYIIPPKGYIFKGFRFDPNASNQVYDGKLIAIYEKEPFNQKVMANLWKFILAFAIIVVVALIVILTAGVFKDPNPKPNHSAKETQVDNPVIAIDSTDIETEDVDTSSAEQTIETEPEVTKTQEKTAQSVANDPNVQFKQAFWTLIHQRTTMMDPYDALFKEYKNKVEGEEYDYLRFTILKDYSTFREWIHKLKTLPESQLQNINTIAALYDALK